MSLKKIDTERGNFTYRESGEGKPVVLLHGWPETSYTWEAVVKNLPQGFRYIRPDLRGLGESTREGGLRAFKKNELAEDIFSILSKLNVEKCVLVGHDWGGVVAQEMALAKPEKIEKLIIMNINIINNFEGMQAAKNELDKASFDFRWYQAFMQMPDLAEKMIPENEEIFLRTFLRTGVKGRAFPEDAIVEYIRCYKLPGSAEAGANYYRAMLFDVKNWGKLVGKKFSMPALLLYGNKDVVVIPAFLENYENCFENATIKFLEAGHFVQDELPVEVAAEMTNFLTAV